MTTSPKGVKLIEDGIDLTDEGLPDIHNLTKTVDHVKQIGAMSPTFQDFDPKTEMQTRQSLEGLSSPMSIESKKNK